MEYIPVYNYRESLCIVRYNDEYYFAYLDLPQPDWTLKKYNDWRSKWIQNAIPLNSNIVPQMLPVSDIQIVCILEEELERYSNKYNMDSDKPNFSFHELYNRCWGKEWPVSAMREYVEEKFKEFVDSQEEV